MTKLAAILIDSFHEAADRKALWVVLVLSGIMVLLCFSISFQSDPPQQSLAKQLSYLGWPDPPPVVWEDKTPGKGFTISDLRPVADSDDWPADLAGGLTFTVTFDSTAKLDEIVRKKLEATAREKRKSRGLPKDSPLEDIAVLPGQRQPFLEQRLAQCGYGHVAVREHGPAVYQAAVRTDYPHELTGVSRVRLLFGLIDVALPGISIAEVVVYIQIGLTVRFAGLAGILVAILVCSGFIPDFLQKGSLDLMLARPIGRARLLLYKYLGGLWFILLMTTVLIGGCWLAISLRTGFWNPWFLACILTITAMFAVLYSATVLFAVLTRSGTVSALLTICLWGLSVVVVEVKQNFHRLFIFEPPPGWLEPTLKGLYAVLPKTTDMNSFNMYFLSHTHLSEAAYQRSLVKWVPTVDWGFSLGTTAGFAVVMLALACWVFARRDY